MFSSLQNREEIPNPAKTACSFAVAAKDKCSIPVQRHNLQCFTITGQMSVGTK